MAMDGASIGGLWSPIDANVLLGEETVFKPGSVPPWSIASLLEVVAIADAHE